jgi:hypothetical protein
VNLAGVRSALEQNKKPLAIAGAVAVGGLALVKSKGGAAEKSAGAPISVQSTGGQAARAAGGVYDSSSSDVYNAIQPQLEKFGAQLADLQNRYTNGQIPTPVPAPPAGVSAPVSVQPVGTPSPVATYPKLNYVQTGPSTWTAEPSTFHLGRTNTSGNPIADQAINNLAGYHDPAKASTSGVSPVVTKGADGIYRDQWGVTRGNAVNQHGNYIWR